MTVPCALEGGVDVVEMRVCVELIISITHSLHYAPLRLDHLTV